MTVLETYYAVQDKLNKLSSNAGANLAKHTFVRHFNMAQDLWVEDRMKRSQTDRVRIDELQPIMKTVELTPIEEKGKGYFKIDLPEDYYHYVRSYSYSGACLIYNWEVREGNMNVVLMDQFWAPSLEWQEIPVTIVGGQLRMYADFPINKVVFTYHRYPVRVNMADNFTDPNGNPTVDVHPEFKGSSLVEIINMTTADIAGITADQLQYQINMNKSIQHT